MLLVAVAARRSLLLRPALPPSAPGGQDQVAGVLVGGAGRGDGAPDGTGAA